ncbi:hypothetical protein AXF42_Ash015704 [Apostasia shenzhenica]|uniref:Uncharacterized protein n=1 Tax=Apostasia shenzhenica TaxID=1088818 RepID=A0A2H9ZU49_9ASPA|nr:hypothetical protein AXF42_Ash015704 [Apostasia shenzhenica]
MPLFRPSFPSPIKPPTAMAERAFLIICERIYSELSFEEIRAGGQGFLAGTAAGGCVRHFLHRSESSRWLRLRFRNDSEIQTGGHGFHRRHGSRRLRSAFFH